MSRDPNIGAAAQPSPFPRRRRNEDEVALHSRIVATMAEGVVAVRSSDDRIVYANQAFESMFGYSSQELVGSPIWIIGGHGSARSAPGSVQMVQQLGSEGAWQGEVRAERKDGTPLWIWANVSAFEHLEHGRVWVGVVSDITERRQAKLELAGERDFIQAVLDTAGALVMTLDRDGRVISFNRAAEALSGHSTEDVVGRHFLETGVVVPEDIPMISAWLANLRACQFPNMHETHWLTPTGERRLVSWRNTALMDESGEIEHVIRTGIDITEQRAFREELRRSNADLEHFASVASHDLAAPLTVVAGYAELLENRYAAGLDESGVRYVQRIAKGTAEMRDLIDELLDFARAGGAAPEREAVDCNQAVADALETFAGEIRGHDVEVDVAPLPVIGGDRALIDIVLRNLISNAIKFRSPDRRPRLSIEAEREEHRWCLHVRDNGIGIAPEAQSTIFDMFDRAPNARSLSGTGIGLATCRRIVERWGGRIRVESEPGRGSRFTFTVPDPVQT